MIDLNQFRNSMEQLSVAEGKLGSVMTRLLGVDIFNKKLEMDEERCARNHFSLKMFTPSFIRFVPEGLGYKTDLFEEEPEKKKDDVDSGPEEEEVADLHAIPPQSFFPPGAHSRIPEATVQPNS